MTTTRRPTDMAGHWDEPSEEDYAIQDVPRGYNVCLVGHQHIGTASTYEEAEEFIRQHAGAARRPNVWIISDHGNPCLVEDFDWGE